MGEPSTSDAEIRRHAEIERALRRSNGTTVFVVFAVALALEPRHGWAFVAWSALPAAYWTLGFALLRRVVGLRRWNVGLLAVATAAIGGAAFHTGGASSPVLFLAPLIGVIASALFPRSGAQLLIGPSIVAGAIGADALAGRDRAALLAIAVLLIASVLYPALMVRLVDVELEHRRRAVIDPLTGCLNRHAFDVRARELEEHSRIVDGTVAAILVDLDHFKNVNDTYGHQMGDEILKHAAYQIRSHLRRFELVYRLGGEEFVVILPGSTVETARSIAEQLRVAIAESTVDGISITASFGVAESGPSIDIADLVNAADEMLYEAKRRGRNIVSATASI